MGVDKVFPRFSSSDNNEEDKPKEDVSVKERLGKSVDDAVREKKEGEVEEVLTQYQMRQQQLRAKSNGRCSESCIKTGSLRCCQPDRRRKNKTFWKKSAESSKNKQRKRLMKSRKTLKELKNSLKLKVQSFVIKYLMLEKILRKK